MPRRIMGGAFVSLDGVMQAPGGPSEDPTGGFPYGGWLATLGDEGLGNQVDTLFSKPFDLLLGRRTYEIFAGFWPFTAQDQEIAVPFNRCRKYVLTRSDVELPWEGSERVGGLDRLAEIKAGEGPDLVIQGSSTLYPQLLEHGLIDRIVTMTAPILLGSGKRLWGEGTPAKAFKLVEHRMTSNGFAMATYDAAGEVETGEIGTPIASPLEQVRQERMTNGSW